MRPLILAACAALLLAPAAHAGAPPDSTVRVVTSSTSLFLETLRHQGQPVRKVDDMAGVTLIWSSLPHGLPHHGDGEVYLTSARDTVGTTYGLVVFDRGSQWKWADLHAGLALVDSTRVDLGRGEWEGDVIATGVLYSEFVRFAVPRRFLELCATATTIRLRVGAEDFTLDPRDAWAWRAFVRATAEP